MMLLAYVKGHQYVLENVIKIGGDFRNWLILKMVITQKI